MRLAILDLDLTILDTLRRFYETYNKTRLKMGLPRVSWDTFMDNFRRDSLNELLPQDIDRRLFWRIFRRLYSGWIHSDDRPIKGAIDTLKWLKDKGFKVIVSTGRDADPDDIWLELRYFGLDNYVDDVYTISMQDPETEDITFLRADLLKKIINNYDANPTETIFVGDYWVDMESGRRVGLITVGVLTGYKEYDLLKSHGADYIIKDISELPKLLIDINFI